MNQVAYGKGWYDEERDGARSFRWMGRAADCLVAGLPAKGSVWLSLRAGHALPASCSPVLAVCVDGQQIGRQRILPGVSTYLFPVGSRASGRIELEVDRTFRVAGDDRALGVLVAGIGLVDLDDVHEPLHAEGWYDWEYDDYFPFRWMGSEARVLLPHQPGASRYVSIPVSADDLERTQTLTVLADGREMITFPLLHRWHVYDLALPLREHGHSAPFDLVLRVSGLLSEPLHLDDPRELGIRVGAIEAHDDARRHKTASAFYEWARTRFIDTAPAQAGPAGPRPANAPGDRAFTADGGFLPSAGEGWFPWQFIGPIPFRWMKHEASVRVPSAVAAGKRFCSFAVSCERNDLSQVLTVLAGAEQVLSVPLLASWQHLTWPLPSQPHGDIRVTLRLSATLRPREVSSLEAAIRPSPELAPDLGVRIGPMRFHDDEDRYQKERQSYANAVLNNEEFETGATELRSFPLSLGIDLSGRCNIKPPCVYCP